MERWIGRNCDSARDGRSGRCQGGFVVRLAEHLAGSREHFVPKCWGRKESAHSASRSRRQGSLRLPSTSTGTAGSRSCSSATKAGPPTPGMCRQQMTRPRLPAKWAARSGKALRPHRRRAAHSGTASEGQTRVQNAWKGSLSTSRIVAMCPCNLARGPPARSFSFG